MILINLISQEESVYKVRTPNNIMERKNLIFRQLFEKETSTYTYLLADKETKEAIIIDPTKDMVERDLDLIKKLNLNLKYILDTHVHADHVTGSNDLREKTGAKIALGIATELKCADILLKDGDELEFGEFKIRAISTPGHTNGCTSYVLEDMVFTGDTMLIGSCGRVDFQQGSAKKIHDSMKKLFELNDETTVYPGHDYKGFTSSTIGEEKENNEFFKGSANEEKFIERIEEMKLPEPKRIHIAVPSNQTCGKEIIEN